MSERKSAPLLVAFRFGDTVFLRCRELKVAGMVTGIHIRQSGITYSITWGDDPARETDHYDFELSPEYVPDYS
jgi:hypothetical protein